ncbi:uncharacterized protein [Diabrotica undecimpunctata]|uniref:uncharacterized protein n=1 Tax=Diabrotica undecimpunctata TaxID=50387 RepID=UPI003B6380B9
MIALLQDQRSQVYVSETLCIPRTTVLRAFHRFVETDTYSLRPDSGRRRITSQRDACFIAKNLLRNRHSTEIAARNGLQEVRNVNVSERTVRRRLNERGLMARRPAIVFELQPRYCKN